MSVRYFSGSNVDWKLQWRLTEDIQANAVCHFPPALLLKAEVQLVEIALQTGGKRHSTGEQSIVSILYQKAITAMLQVRWTSWKVWSCLTKIVCLFWDSCIRKYIFICIMKLAKILDFYSICPVVSVYTDHIICTQIRLVIISPFFSSELPNVWLISSDIRKSQFLRMASCFIYTDKHVPCKNFHNIWLIMFNQIIHVWGLANYLGRSGNLCNNVPSSERLGINIPCVVIFLSTACWLGETIRHL